MEIYGLIIIAAVISTFAVVMMRRNQLMDIEAHEKLTHKFNCGGRFRNGRFFGMKLSGPFVQVRMYSEFMVISYVFKIKLDYRDIIEIKRGSFGYRILTTDFTAPKFIVLVCRPEDIALVESKIR